MPFHRHESIHKGLDLLLKIAHLTIQEVKRLLVSDFILDGILLVSLVGFLGGQFSDKLGQLLLDGGGASDVVLVVAEVDQEPGQVVIGSADLQADSLRDGLGHLVSVDADGVLARQPQVVREGARQLLHEGVDGADAEAAVVVHNLGHQALGVAFQIRSADAQFFYQTCPHRSRLKRRTVDDLAKGLHYFVLHLVGSGVGKGNGEDMLVIVHAHFIGEAQLQVFLDKGESLARACRGLIHLELRFAWHEYQLFSSFLGLIMGCEFTTGFFLNRLRKLSNERLYERPKPWV